MLAVDGKQEAAATRLGGERQLARGDEALLVRQRKRDTLLERPEGRPDAGEPDDRVEDDVGLAPFEELDRIAAHLRVSDAVFLGQRVERRRPRLERAELELRVGADDVDRLPADRPGCAEDRDACHAARMPERP